MYLFYVHRFLSEMQLIGVKVWYLPYLLLILIVLQRLFDDMLDSLTLS